MLQNRVDPFGQIIRTSTRGGWIGNRGVIHNEFQEIVRPYKIKAWITCLLEFRGRHREIMQPNRWTELFFLDEATSFSAGHRPCFQCRYKDHQRFKNCWLKGNPEYGFHINTPIFAIDHIIHTERISSHRSVMEDVKSLPDGSFVVQEEKPYLIRDRMMYRWTPAGYADGLPVAGKRDLVVLTPVSIVKMFVAGYIPQMAL